MCVCAHSRTRHELGFGRLAMCVCGIRVWAWAGIGVGVHAFVTDAVLRPGAGDAAGV